MPKNGIKNIMNYNMPIHGIKAQKICALTTSMTNQIKRVYIYIYEISGLNLGGPPILKKSYQDT